MRNDELRFKVYPVAYVKGFVPTFCRTMECAMKVRKQMTDVTKVEWRVRTIN